MLCYTTLHRFKAPFVFLFLKNIEDSPSTCALAKTPRWFMVISSHLCYLGCNQHVLPQELARVLTPTGRAIWFSLPAETRAHGKSCVVVVHVQLRASITP